MPSTGPGHGLALVAWGAGLIYSGVWLVFQPAGAWRLMQDLMEGIQRFSSTLHGASSWEAQPVGSSGTPRAPITLRMAGAVVALMGIVSLAGGLSQWA